MTVTLLPDEERRALSQPAAHPLCAHCGLEVASGLVRINAPQQFCCTGCETVFGLLQNSGLGQYYTFPERRTERVSDSAASYAEFDHPAFQALYVRPTDSGNSTIELYLEGIHCASCVWLVERVPLLISGVVRAELSVRRSLATIEWDARALALSEIAKVLSKLGYPCHPYRGVTRDSMRRKEDRAMLARIGVAGAIAINVMLAALALYSGERNGMDGSFEKYFRWISLLITVPSFVWPGRVFFAGAWSAWKTRSLHMDVPIAIALAAGLVRGAINTVTDSGPVYFDGLAILIFALLVGRFLQQRGQRMAADSAELLHALSPSSARIIDNGDTRDIPVAALLPGMTMSVRAGETFAADGVVTHGMSSVNAALLTGESRPVRVTEGDRVFGGTLNSEGPLLVRVEEAGESSRIARLLAQVEESARRRAPVVLFANRLAGIFIAVVLTAAALTLAIKWQVSPGNAVDDAIALLIVTCPCALALATPLAITVAIGRAAHNRILVKGGDALELLATPGTLVLDKTGTLTEGHTTLVHWHGTQEVRDYVHALEMASSHPLADGFRRAWGSRATLVASDIVSVTGSGVQGTFGTHTVRVGSRAWVCSDAQTVNPEVIAQAAQFARSLTVVYVSVDRRVVAVAALGDALRPDALASLRELRRQGWRTEMLSGDSADVAHEIGRELEFAADQIFASASPEEKLSHVRQRLARGERVVMVGDGVNDAAAIAAATVGVGVHGGAEACLANADIYLTRPGLQSLVQLIDGTRRTTRVIKRNVAFSVAYNIVGAGLAIAGMLTPLVAAILMPASSITVILASWFGRTFPRARGHAA